MPGDVEKTNYDAIADDFLTHIARPNSWNNLYERPNMLARLPALEGKNVLDLGCSSGFYTDYALEHGAAVTAIDASKVMINKLTERIKSPKLKLVCADISEPMPFLKPDSFDVVICSLVIDYIKNWTPLFAEIYRVTKKGGRLVMATHHPSSIYQYLVNHRRAGSYFDFKMIEDKWSSPPVSAFKTHYYIRPLNEVLRPIIQSKFKIISIDEPLPDERCKEIDFQIYKRLREKPGFLFFVLEK
jgi:SAM-dependent methyltransferase